MVQPRLHFGLNVWNRNHFNPIRKAQWSWAEQTEYADWVKPITYQHQAGEVFDKEMGIFGSTILRDFTMDEFVPAMYRMLGLREAPAGRVVQDGMDPDSYVFGQCADAVRGVAGRVPVYMGIGVDAPRVLRGAGHVHAGYRLPQRACHVSRGRRGRGVLAELCRHEPVQPGRRRTGAGGAGAEAVTMRVLLAGLGNRGRVWARLIAEHSGLSFAGVVDPDPGRRVAYASLPGFADLAPALAETAPDMLVLATPPEGHPGQTRAAFASGIPVLCEKPLTLDLADAVAIVRDAEDLGVPLSVGLNFRFLPVSQALRGLVTDAAFGAPGFGSFHYWRNRDWWRQGMNTYPLHMRHPMMLEQTIHHLDLIRFCYGREVAAVSCRSWNPPWSAYRHDANVSCLLSLEGGLEVDYLGTWTGGWNELNFLWRTDCPDGVILQRELFGDLATARTADPALTAVPLAPCEPFLDDTRALLDAFVSALAAGVALPCTGRDHLQTLALCFAAIEADETGRRVDMAAFGRAHGIAA